MSLPPEHEEIFNKMAALSVGQAASFPVTGQWGAAHPLYNRVRTTKGKLNMIVKTVIHKGVVWILRVE